MNYKNPTPLFFERMRRAGEDMGTLGELMVNFLQKNYGVTDIPKTVADDILYDQQRVTGTNTQFFQNQYTVTRSNMPGGSFTLPQAEHFIILGMRLLDGVAATDIVLDEADWQPGIRDNVVKNGKMTINANTTRVITGLPVTAFDNNELAATQQGQSSEDRGFFYLYEPLVWLAQTQFPIDLLLNANKVVPTVNYAVRVELHGIRFIGS